MKEQKEKRWNLQSENLQDSDREKIRELAQECGFSSVMTELLYLRGCHTEDEVTCFLNQGEAQFHNPFLMQDMEKAVTCIREALEKHKKIAIYGDYDVDGVTSVTLLYLYLFGKGADVGYYIPSRAKEGYGLSNSAMDTLAEKGVQFMITVDTGITANAEVEYAKGLGIETVVTDHHTCCGEIPNASAVVNPHRPDDAYPFKELAGVGVVFKLICAMEIALCRETGIPEIDGVRKICREYADLVALGTIADVMPAVDENRLIEKLGLSLLNRGCRKGLSALMNAAAGDQAKKRKVNSGYIGFCIAPRINAAGRVSTATIAVELLLAEKDEDAMRLAQQLCDLNAARQVEENRIAEQASKKIAETFHPETDRVIVIDDDSWQQGIIGIVSSRITERYGVPSLLISFDGATRGYPCLDDSGKGSGRSVRGLNLVDALGSCADLLERFGGHELAAGLSIRRANIDEFRRRINAYAKEHLDENSLIPTVDADCEVSMGDLTMQLASEIEKMEPFGMANPVPVFALKDAVLQKSAPMGNGKHLRLTVEKDGISMNAVWFNAPEFLFRAEAGQHVDLLFQLNLNEYMGNTSLQMILQDVHTSTSFLAENEAAKARYEEIRAGGNFESHEEILPSRDDVALVYTVLRREFRNGHTVFPIQRILSLLGGKMNYVKLKFIIRMMQELKICGVTESGEDTYVFDFYYQAEKTNIEKSSILKKLRMQMR